MVGDVISEVFPFGRFVSLVVQPQILYESTTEHIRVISSLGTVEKTGDGTLQIVSAASGQVKAESWVISSGRIDVEGYFSGKVFVDEGAEFSPGIDVGSVTIDSYNGSATKPGELILNTASKLVMDIGGPNINDNDSLIVEGPLTFKDNSFIYLVAAEDCKLKDGDMFTVVISGNNGDDYINDPYFFRDHVRSDDFKNLVYVQLPNGKYAITGRYTPTLLVVPEPSTWALMFLGVAGLLFLRKRR